MSVLKKRFLSAFALAIGSVFIVNMGGCGSDDPVYVVNTQDGDVAVSGVSLSETSANLNTGDTMTLVATLTPSYAKAASLVWSSSADAVAMVSQKGVVTALDTGTAVIKVVANGDETKTAYCTFTVTAKVTGIKLDTANVTVSIGRSDTLGITILPDNATNRGLLWFSRDTNIVKVDTNGVITGIAKGSTTVTVTTVDGEFTDIASITVIAAVERVVLSHTELVIKAGQNFVLSASIEPEDAVQEVRWSSNDTNRVAVDPVTGRISARYPGAAAVITATSVDDTTKAASCAVTVEAYAIPHTFNVSNGDEWFEAIDGIRYNDTTTADKSYKINVTSDFNLTEIASNSFGRVTKLFVEITGNYAVGLASDSAADAGTLLVIAAGQSVVLTDIDIVGNGAGGDHPAISVTGAKGATAGTEGLTMRGTASITGNGGAGVNVGANGYLSMTNNASISGNAKRGVLVDGGYFVMSGSSMLAGNSVDDGHGGGVLVTGGGTFAMTEHSAVGGKSGGNSVTGGFSGGGVAVTGAGSKFYMSDAAMLHENTTDGNGGGVAVLDGGEFELSGYAAVHKNTAGEFGHGGGVYITSNSKFTMDGYSSISENETGELGDGGGVSIDGGVFTMANGTIWKNVVSSPSTEMTGGILDGDKNNYGGGVSVRHEGTFNFVDGIIGGNEALYGGGVFVYGTFAMSGGKIYGLDSPDSTNTSVGHGWGSALLVSDEALATAAFGAKGFEKLFAAVDTDGNFLYFDYNNGIVLTMTVEDGELIKAAPAIGFSGIVPTISLIIGKGESSKDTTLSATVIPAASKQGVIWSSGDTTIATVDSLGKVTAIDTGTAVITATSITRFTIIDGELYNDRPLTFECRVTVYRAADSVEIRSSQNITLLDVGATETISIAVTPDNATDKSVKWESSLDGTTWGSGLANGIFTLKDGVVTAVSAGTAYIKVTPYDKIRGYDDISGAAICTVTVDIPAEAVVLSRQNATVVFGGADSSVTLTATVYGKDNSLATNKLVTWKSGDESLAKLFRVCPDGDTLMPVLDTDELPDNTEIIVVALDPLTESAEVNIVAASVDGNKSSTCAVTVTVAVKSVTVAWADSSLLSGLKVGKKYALTAVMTPAYATNKSVVWSKVGDVEILESGNASAVIMGAAPTTDAKVIVTAEDNSVAGGVIPSDTLQGFTITGYEMNHQFVVSTGEEWLEAVNGIRYSGSGTRANSIRVAKDIELAGTATFGGATGAVTVYGNQKVTLASGVSGSALDIGTGLTVTLRDADIVGHSGSTEPLVKVGGALDMRGTATLSGSGGVGVQLTAGAFDMNDNTAVYGHGGRAVRVTGGAFTMDGTSEIYGSGGGAYVSGGTFTMKGTSTVRDNSGAPGDGGGVLVLGTGTFTMDGTATAVKNNSASGNGGGVSARDGGTFTLTSGQIHDNATAVAYGHGGGVYVGLNATATVNGGAIRDNSTASYGDGGGVRVDGAFTMANAVISGNKTGDNGYGGGVSVRQSGTFTMTSGGISGNTATQGGGVYTYGTLTMNGGVIYGVDEAATTNARTGNVASAVLFVHGSPAGSATIGTSSPITWSSGTGTDNTIRINADGTPLVNGAVTGITLTNAATPAIINRGATENFTATVLPANATNKAVTWSSSNTAAATVDANGVVAGVFEGTATITVTTVDGGFTASRVVNVKNGVTGINVTPATTPVALLVGQKYVLSAEVIPADATNKAVTWISSNTSFVTVTNGVVIAVGAGTADVTVTSSDNAAASAVITFDVAPFPSTFNASTADHWETAIRGISLGTATDYTINVTRGFTLDTIAVNGIRGSRAAATALKVTVVGNQTISLASGIEPKSLLVIASGDTVNLVDVDIRGSSGNTQPLIDVATGGALNMIATASITDNGGVGVRVAGINTAADPKGALTMYDNASISGNSRGVFVNGGRFVMNGSSKVHGNSMAGGGAGVLVRNVGQFTMNDHATLYENTASGDQNDGGGVLVMGNNAADSSTFTMASATARVYGNSTSGRSSNGGGVAALRGGKVVLTNGVVHGNSTSNYGHGGGVYVASGATLSMTGANGIVHSNSTGMNGNGAGVYVEGVFTMTNGVVGDTLSGTARGNKAGPNGYGGGVAVGPGGTFNLNGGGGIRANGAFYGGGVSAHGTFVGDGNLIINTNTADGSGNILYAAIGSTINLTNRIDCNGGSKPCWIDDPVTP